MREKHVGRTKEKGITLIALVVTIVVLLILAGVSITVLFGDSGIITMAQKAADETDKAAEKDQEDLNKLNEYLTNGNWGGSTKPTDPENPDNPPVDPPKEPVYPEKGGKVPVQADGKTNVEWKETINGVEKVAKIPVGFCVVKDLKDAEGNIIDENNITNGLVISDVANDDLDNTAKGNQFVWIPVEVDESGNTPNFRRIEGFRNGARQSYLADCKEAGKEGITTTESIAIYQSVAENGGFYIARFEAGLEGTKDEDLSSTERPTPDGITQKPVSKKGVVPWNYIPWSISTENGSDGLSGKDSENGAVKVARSMYTKSATCGVTPTLCYGVQWDAVMQYIDPNYLWKMGETDNVASDSVVRNGEGKGNYSGGLKVTGQYQQNHIYDLAGNVYEWTMEAYDAVYRYRVLRGGLYDSTGSYGPASSRFNRSPVSAGDDRVGFRQALYV